MKVPIPPAEFRTHDAFNQPPPLAGYDLFRSDMALRSPRV